MSLNQTIRARLWRRWIGLLVRLIFFYLSGLGERSLDIQEFSFVLPKSLPDGEYLV